MHKRKIIFRVDGNSKIGLGHISRCCALADMLKQHFKIYFYTRANSETVLNDIKNYCVDVFQLDTNIPYEDEAASWLVVLKGDEIVVLDGYNFNTAYQQRIKEKGCKLVCIDDIHAYHFVADIVINHAPGIEASAYSCEAYAKLYFGTEYVLLKKMFLKQAGVLHKTFDLKNSPILICFGGADPDDNTGNTLEEMTRTFPERKAYVIVGAAYNHLNKLQKLIKNNNSVSLHINIKPEDMLALMQQSQIAITSASTIALEYVCVKGNLFLKCIAGNQRQIYNSLIQKQCAYAFENLKESFCLDQNILQQKKLIDGKSGERLLNIFRSLNN